jgi:hypothetical protein
MQCQLLEAYAIEKARWQDAEAFIRQNGVTLVLRNDKGEVRAVQEVPELKIAQRSRDAALKLALQLGLGLSSPARRRP